MASCIICVSWLQTSCKLGFQKSPSCGGRRRERKKRRTQSSLKNVSEEGVERGESEGRVKEEEGEGGGEGGWRTCSFFSNASVLILCSSLPSVHHN